MKVKKKELDMQPLYSNVVRIAFRGKIAYPMPHMSTCSIKQNFIAYVKAAFTQ